MTDFKFQLPLSRHLLNNGSEVYLGWARLSHTLLQVPILHLLGSQGASDMWVSLTNVLMTFVPLLLKVPTPPSLMK